MTCMGQRRKGVNRSFPVNLPRDFGKAKVGGALHGEREMSANGEAPSHRPPPRSPYDLLTCGLCLFILTLSAGILLDQAGVGGLLFRTESTSDDAELEALLFAIGCGDVSAARRVLRQGRVDVNGADNVGGTPLHYALRVRGSAAEVLLDLLIDAGADVNARDRGGMRTPLLAHAASLRRPELVARLLRAGAKPKGAGCTGWTALHYAALCDDAETAAVLLAAGASPSAKDDEGQTPLDVAVVHGSRAAAALLVASHP